MGVELCLERDELLTEFGKKTLRGKYLLPGESYQDCFKRVATAYGSNPDHAQRLYDYMSNLWFMPATPVLANGGTDRGLPISCFLQQVDDDIGAIIDTFSEMAWLSVRGGGIGIDWSKVREAGAPVGGVGTSNGIAPWAVIQNAYTRGLNQGDVRTASSALYLDVDHPEIMDFIEIREPGGDLSMKALECHHGINITDRFMDAVREDEEFDLISRADGSVVNSIPAREIWTKILDMRMKTGEPYLLFKDEANRKSSEVYKRLGLKVKQSNLCVEIMLHTGKDHLGVDRSAVCCLSSVNAEKYLMGWENHPTFIRDVLEFLDNVLQDFIDRTEGKKGFERARYSAIRERAVGLGVMGFHGLLMQNMIPFGSIQAKNMNRRLFKDFSSKLSEANHELALERGPCPDAQEAGLDLRFSHASAVAPTASISIICGEATSGIEPVPAMEFVRKTDAGSHVTACRFLDRYLRHQYGKGEKHVTAAFSSVDDYLSNAWEWVHEHGGSIQGWPWAPEEDLEVFKTAFEIDQRWVVELAADRDEYIEQGQSLNLFFPGNSDKGYINATHLKAANRGVRSLYYVRSTPVVSAQHDATEALSEKPSFGADRRDADECLPCQ